MRIKYKEKLSNGQISFFKIRTHYRRPCPPLKTNGPFFFFGQEVPAAWSVATCYTSFQDLQHCRQHFLRRICPPVILQHLKNLIFFFAADMPAGK
jgi:hypothetical protein